MKRLIKKSTKKNTIKNLKRVLALINKIDNKKTATLDVEKLSIALDELLGENDGYGIKRLTNDIKNEDPDCVHNGVVYRKLTFDLEDLLQRDPNGEEMISKDDLLKAIKRYISTGYYQSSSESLNACEEFENNYDGLDVIVSYNVEDGISIHKLLDKYVKILREMAIKIENDEYDEEEYGEDADIVMEAFTTIESLHSSYSAEEEVYGKMPNEYEIVKTNNIFVSDLPEEFELSHIL